MTPRSDDVAPRTLKAEHVQAVQLTAWRQLWTLLLRPRADGPATEERTADRPAEQSNQKEAAAFGQEGRGGGESDAGHPSQPIS